MSWLDDIQKDLQDAKQHPSREKKDWEIERDIRAKDLGISNKGTIQSDETRRKKSESTKGLSKSQEHSKKIAQALKGKHKSEEHKQKLSESKMGVKCPHTSKKNSEMNSKLFKCDHCTQDIGGEANYKRFHGDECWANGLDIDEIWNTFVEEKWSISTLSKYLGVSTKSLKRWVKWMQEK